MKQSVSFKGDHVAPLSQDFEALRALGLQHIQKLSGDVWTDFNSHDPGVTILEQLCYALTDVAYRTSHSIEDLLMSELKRPEAAAKNALLAPSKVFSTHPVTILDVKKRLVDHFDEIQNVWIDTPKERGYANRLRHTKRIEILPKLVFNNAIQNETAANESFLKELRSYLKSIRNIGEDIEEICLLGPHNVTVKFELYLVDSANISETIVRVFLALFEHVYNPVVYYSFDEMIKEGYDVAHIFSGPKLRKGFVKDKSLKRRKLVLRVESLKKMISKVDGVQTAKVHGILNRGELKQDVTIDRDSFFHLLRDDRKDYLTDNRFESIYNGMQIFIGNKKYNLTNQQIINYQFREAWAKKYRGYPIGKSQEDFFYDALNGVNRNVKEYYSIQNHFPMIYGIGSDGIPKKEPAERHAQAKQLKGFLSFFEQHLANHLAQLNKVDSFFNIDFEKSEKQTYFSQNLDSAPNYELINPTPTFQIKAVVYATEFWEGNWRKKHEIVLDTSLQALQKSYSVILHNYSLFQQFMKEEVQLKIHPILLQNHPESSTYLEALLAVDIEAPTKNMPANFWKITVVSFMVLMAEEKKYFQAMVFAESFFMHLRRVLQAANCGHKFGCIYAQLKSSYSQPIHQLLKHWKVVESKVNGLDFFDRKNRTYSHLLARFGEHLNPLPWNVSRQLNIIPDNKSYQYALLKSKADFLKQIELIGSGRMRGESFIREQVDNVDEVSLRKPSGLELMVVAKTAIPLRKYNWSLNKHNQKTSTSLIPEFANARMEVEREREDVFSEPILFSKQYRALRSDEIKKPHDTGKPIEMPAAMFGKIKLKSLFKRPLDFSNYRMSRTNGAKKKVEVIFQKETNLWVSLFESNSIETAVSNIHNIVRMCRKVNHDSEGFYIVDQILLRSFLNEANVGYGFQFLDEYGRVFCETSAKKSLASAEEERDANLKAFYKDGLHKKNYHLVNGKYRLMKDPGGGATMSSIPLVTFMDVDIAIDDLVAKTSSLIQLFNTTNEDNGRLRVKEVEKIRLNGITDNNHPKFGQRRLNYLRKFDGKKSVSEDFFDQEISVVLPNWPARFQDDRFVSFFENLIYERTPSHLKCSILWLDKNEMQLFESVYHPWEETVIINGTGAKNGAAKGAAYDVYNTLLALKNRN